MVKISNIDVNNPTGLQQRVFVNMQLHFIRRGCEGLRELKKSSFIFSEDENKHEFITIEHREIQKNDQGMHKNTNEEQNRMYATEGENCPVRLMRKYLSKLNEQCPFFFQKPKQKFTQDGIWYCNMVLGKNTLGKFMSEISKAANLSTRYTNHCLRATAAQTLSRSGVERSTIQKFTGHKQVTSLDPYIQSTSSATKHLCSKVLHEHTVATSTNDAQITDIPSTSTNDAQITDLPSTSTNDAQNTNISLSQNLMWQAAPLSLFQNSVIHAGANITINFNNSN